MVKPFLKRTTETERINLYALKSNPKSLFMLLGKMCVQFCDTHPSFLFHILGRSGLGFLNL